MKVSNILTTYFWKNLECELCKTAYPYETRSLDGKKMLNIIEYDTPQPEVDDVSGQVIEAQYIVLESISSNTSKVIHVVNMKEKDDNELCTLCSSITGILLNKLKECILVDVHIKSLTIKRQKSVQIAVWRVVGGGE